MFKNRAIYNSFVINLKPFDALKNFTVSPVLGKKIINNIIKIVSLRIVKITHLFYVFFG